jgi:hypothetical protein
MPPKNIHLPRSTQVSPCPVNNSASRSTVRPRTCLGVCTIRCFVYRPPRCPDIPSCSSATPSSSSSRSSSGCIPHCHTLPSSARTLQYNKNKQNKNNKYGATALYVQQSMCNPTCFNIVRIFEEQERKMCFNFEQHNIDFKMAISNISKYETHRRLHMNVGGHTVL